MDYQFQKEICHNCGKPEFCISKGLTWLCHDCFSWAVDYAEQKDLMKQILQDQNIYDLELRNDRDWFQIMIQISALIDIVMIQILANVGIVVCIAIVRILKIELHMSNLQSSKKKQTLSWSTSNNGAWQKMKMKSSTYTKTNYYCGKCGVITSLQYQTCLKCHEVLEQWKWH